MVGDKKKKHPIAGGGNEEFNRLSKQLNDQFKKGIISALRARYEADMLEADATINIYLTNSVGIGEHPQHIEEVDKLVSKIAEAKDKLEVLEDFDGWSRTN